MKSASALPMIVRTRSHTVPGCRRGFQRVLDLRASPSLIALQPKKAADPGLIATKQYLARQPY